MAKNRRTYDSYPRDAFDNPPRGPVGVHRGSPSVAARLVPYLVVIVVAALAGALVWAVFSGGLSSVLPWGHEAASTQTSTATTGQTSSTQDSAGSGDTSSSSDAGSTDASPSDGSSSASASESTDAVAQGVNKATAVRVINATKINGYAAEKAAILKQAGFTSVTAGNPTGEVPSSTVVWYENDSDAATAQEVASELGISSVSQVSGLSAPVTVVLLS